MAYGYTSKPLLSSWASIFRCVRPGLGIGRYQGEVGGIPQELLSWYDQQGTCYLTVEEQAQQQTRAERLAQHLHSLGIDPDNLPSE